MEPQLALENASFDDANTLRNFRRELDAEVIAENEYGIQGFRCGDVVGIQSHPEYDRETAETVARDKDLPDDRIEAVCAGITDQAYNEARAATRVFDNFVRRAARSRAAAGDD